LVELRLRVVDETKQKEAIKKDIRTVCSKYNFIKKKRSPPRWTLSRLTQLRDTSP